MWKNARESVTSYVASYRKHTHISPKKPGKSIKSYDICARLRFAIYYMNNICIKQIFAVRLTATVVAPLLLLLYSINPVFVLVCASIYIHNRMRYAIQLVVHRLALSLSHSLFLSRFFLSFFLPFPKVCFSFTPKYNYSLNSDIISM